MHNVVLTESGADTLDQAIGVLPKLFNLANTCFNAVVENPVLLLFFAGGLIGVGLGIFNKLKRSAKG